MSRRKVRAHFAEHEKIKREVRQSRKGVAFDLFNSKEWAPLGSNCFLNSGKDPHIKDVAGHVCSYDGHARTLMIEEDGTLGCPYCAVKVGKRKAMFVTLHAKTSGTFELGSMKEYLEKEWRVFAAKTEAKTAAPKDKEPTNGND